MISDPPPLAVLFLDHGGLARVFDADLGGSTHLINDFDDEVLKPLGMVGDQIGENDNLLAVYYVGQREVISNPDEPVFHEVSGQPRKTKTTYPGWFDKARRRTLKRAYQRGTRMFPAREAALREANTRYPTTEDEWWSRRRG